MRLEAAVLKTHLRRQSLTLYTLSRFFEPDQREGIESLLIFIEILNHSVAKAGSRVEALQAVGDLENLFKNGVTHISLIEQPEFDVVVDTHPNFGLAWEAWCSLEERFGLSRSMALDFIESLRFDSEGRRPQNLEDLLRYVFQSAGVFGAALSRILVLDASFTQAAVDGASSARFSTLARNYRHDLNLGRNRIPVTGEISSASSEPTALLTKSADTLYRSFNASLSKVSFKPRLAMAIALVLHRAHGRSWTTRLDHVVDAVIRISAQRLSEFFQRRPTRPMATTAADIDRAVALKNQNLRLSRGTTNTRPNDHKPDTPSTSR